LQSGCRRFLALSVAALAQILQLAHVLLPAKGCQDEGMVHLPSNRAIRPYLSAADIALLLSLVLLLLPLPRRRAPAPWPPASADARPISTSALSVSFLRCLRVRGAGTVSGSHRMNFSDIDAILGCCPSGGKCTGLLQCTRSSSCWLPFQLDTQLVVTSQQGQNMDSMAFSSA